MTIHSQILFIGIIIALSLGCKNQSSSKQEDTVLVSVGNRDLKKSEIQSILIPGTTKQDSVAIYDGYIQNWILESLMIIEAEKKVAADINIDKLVGEYRSSLLVDNYEKRIVEQQLDTLVESDELASYYGVNKSQFLLSQPVLKCLIAKISNKIKGVDNVEKALSKSDLTEAMILIKEKSVFHHLDTASWLTVDDVKGMIPLQMAEDYDFDTKKTYKYRDRDNQYFVKIVKYYGENEIPPLSYIKDKIAKVILTERKTILLKQVRKSLYDEAMRKKQIEIKSNS